MDQLKELGELTNNASQRDLMDAIREDGERLTPKLRAVARMTLDETERFIRASSKEICRDAGISEPTLIRFCQSFGHSGLSDFRIDLALSLARHARAGRFVEPLPGDRRQTNPSEKRALGERAVALIKGDDAILVDNGSTAEFFAAALGQSDPLTIMTTGLQVAHNAMSHDRHTVMLTGGRIRRRAMSLTGGLVEATLADLKFDTFVMGADSIDAQHGLSTFREEEARQTRAMVEAAGRVIVLADSTKFSKPALHKICDLDRVAILVTDLAEADPRMKEIRARGIEVIHTEMDVPA